MMHAYGFGMGGFGWLFQIVILVLFFMVLWWMMRNSQGFGYKSAPDETASDILKKRLASGEIDTKEYRRLKKELDS